MLQWDRIGISEEMDINEINTSKQCDNVTIGILKIYVLRMNHIFAMAVMTSWLRQRISRILLFFLLNKMIT